MTKPIDNFNVDSKAHQESMLHDPAYARRFHKAQDKERNDRRHDTAHNEAMMYDPAYARRYRKKTGL